jgi:hypothetical protein
MTQILFSVGAAAVWGAVGERVGRGCMLAVHVRTTVRPDGSRGGNPGGF